MGVTTLPPIGGSGNGGGKGRKEGDSTGGLWPARRGPGAWPTLVIEVGDSESLPRLRLDIRRWFFLSNYEVKIVIFAKFHCVSQRLLLEKWVERPIQRPRGGAATTRAWTQATMAPRLVQKITITRVSVNPERFNVGKKDLVLEFRLLLSRNPGSDEDDIVISRADLGFILRRESEIVCNLIILKRAPFEQTHDVVWRRPPGFGLFYAATIASVCKFCGGTQMR